MIKFPIELLQEFKLVKKQHVFSSHYINVVNNTNSGGILSYVLIRDKTERKPYVYLLNLLNLKTLFVADIEDCKCIVSLPGRGFHIRHDVICNYLFDVYKEQVHTSSNKEMDLIIMSILCMYGYSFWFWHYFYNGAQIAKFNEGRKKETEAFDRGIKYSYTKLLPLLI